MTFSTRHRFNYAYPLSVSDTLIDQLWDFATEQYGQRAAKPQILVVNHQHMQRAAQNVAQHRAAFDVYGWSSSDDPAQIYISDRVKPSRRVADQAIIVHEFVHTLQLHNNSTLSIEQLEQEAVSIESRFLARQ